MNRTNCLISSTIGELLVKQLAHELKNRNLYLSFANYYALEGITDLENYYIKRAAEEDNHHNWVREYLSEADYKYMYPQIDKNTETFSKFNEPFVLTITREIQTTQMIYEVYEQASSEKDCMTVSWLYKYLINEQVELCRA